VLPDATIALDYILKLTIDVVRGMRVYPERMRQNLESSGGLVYSQSVLLALVDAGASREDAYAAVQRAAMRTWESGTHFKETLLDEPSVATVMDVAALDAIMQPSRYLANMDTVFKKLEGLQ
jgi:adenylosuccinate lyase